MKDFVPILAELMIAYTLFSQKNVTKQFKSKVTINSGRNIVFKLYPNDKIGVLALMKSLICFLVSIKALI